MRPKHKRRGEGDDAGHRWMGRGRQGSRRAVCLLAALGCALAAAGLLADGGGWLLATRVVTSLVALVPLKKSLEHGEPAEGLAVLPMRSPEPATEPA